MKQYPITHTNQVDTLFPIIFTLIKAFYGKVVIKRSDCLTKADAMLLPIGNSFVIILFKLICIIHNIRDASSIVNCLLETKRYGKFYTVTGSSIPERVGWLRVASCSGVTGIRSHHTVKSETWRTKTKLFSLAL